MTKFFKIIGYIIPLNWFLNGILVICSIRFNVNSFLVNTIIGILFLLISFLFFLRNNFFLHFIKNQKYHKIIRIEIIFIVINLIISLVALSAIVSRLLEGYSIFG